MVKLIALLLSLGVGGFFGYYFHQYVNSVCLDVLIGIGFFIATFLALVILFFLTVYLLTFYENKNKKRMYQSTHFRRLLYKLDLFLFSLFGMKLHCSGIEQLSISEQYIIVSNHRSNVDSMVIDKYLKRFPLVFITKDSLFKVPFVGRVIHGCAYLKLNRGALTEEFETFEDANTMLTRFDKPLSVGIFPEGTRNKSDDATSVQEFKPGSFRMAKKAMCPIAISVLRGTKEINNNLLFKRHHIYYDIIEVLEYEEYKDWDLSQIAKYCEDKISKFLKETIK